MTDRGRTTQRREPGASSVYGSRYGDDSRSRERPAPAKDPRDSMTQKQLVAAQNVPKFDKPRLSPDEEGSIGQRVAAKNEILRAAKAAVNTAAATAELEPTDEDTNRLEEILSKEGINIDRLVEAIQAPAKGGRSQKRRMRGGDPRENVAVVKAVVLMVAYNTARVAAGLAPPAVDFIRRELSPLFPAGGRALEIAADLALQIFRTPITLALLTVGGVGYTANVASKVVKRINEWGRGMSATLLSEEAAENAADAAFATGTATVKTVVVSAAVLNQLGLLPLSAVVAILLVGLKANLATGTSRAYLVASFYAWYLGQPEDKQTEINKVASEYAAAAAAGVTEAAKEAGAALGDLLATASPAAAEVVGMAAAPAVITVDDKPIAVAGKSAFEVAAEAIKGSGQPVEVLNAKGVEGKAAATGAIATAGEAVKRTVRKAGVLPKSESEPVEKEEWVELTKLPKTAALAAAADAAAAKRPKRRGGGRKTKKRSSKRRVTRRAKPTRVLGTPVFVY
jgi:hypothetical protein